MFSSTLSKSSGKHKMSTSKQLSNYNIKRNKRNVSIVNSNIMNNNKSNNVSIRYNKNSKNNCRHNANNNEDWFENQLWFETNFTSINSQKCTARFLSNDKLSTIVLRMMANSFIFDSERVLENIWIGPTHKTLKRMQSQATNNENINNNMKNEAVDYYKVSIGYETKEYDSDDDDADEEYEENVIENNAQNTISEIFVELHTNSSKSSKTHMKRLCNDLRLSQQHHQSYEYLIFPLQDLYVFEDHCIIFYSFYTHIPMESIIQYAVRRTNGIQNIHYQHLMVKSLGHRLLDIFQCMFNNGLFDINVQLSIICAHFLVLFKMIEIQAKQFFNTK